MCSSTVVTEITMAEITYIFIIHGNNKIVIVTLSQVTRLIDDTDETIDMTVSIQMSDVEARTELMMFTRTILGVEIKECRVAA